MTVNLSVENANKDLIKAFKNMAKASGAKLTIKQDKKLSESLKRTIKEVRQGKVEKFKDFESYKKDMNSYGSIDYGENEFIDSSQNCEELEHNKYDIDLSEARNHILNIDYQDITSELSIFDNQKCTFYYDESNNPRKFWLRENDFNAPVDKNFILGGVMHFGDTSASDIEDLKNQLKLQKTIKEIKFKHISNTTSFLDCLNSDKVSIFLRWLYDSDLYVHYLNLNHLYDAIIDIIETIPIDNIEIIARKYDYSNVRKFKDVMTNELYKIARNHYGDFYRLLLRYDYPNIAHENIKEFYKCILSYTKGNSWKLKSLSKVLRKAEKQKELVFLQGNEKKIIIDDYSHLYISQIVRFLYAQHIFDNEYNIEKLLDEYFLHVSEKIEYRFTDSKDEPFIQISDCLVGLLGKYYTFLNSFDKSQISQLSNKQQETLCLFVKLLVKSDNKSQLLINSIQSREDIKNHYKLYNLAIALEGRKDRLNGDEGIDADELYWQLGI
ncbi:MAG: DUF3800 domain-containing protein [Clostridia bacterium]|nr:DUF3800 domain-containing protein [Clostridia bacterium]